jgi:hypothetical protein
VRGAAGEEKGEGEAGEEGAGERLEGACAPDERKDVNENRLVKINLKQEKKNRQIKKLFLR